MGGALTSADSPRRTQFSSLSKMKVHFDLPPSVQRKDQTDEGNSTTFKPTSNGALQHLTYACANFTGPGSQMIVEPISYQRLFTVLPSVKIPLFQRTYCWTDQQIFGWWSDAQGFGSRGSTIIGGAHGTGKCVFKKYVEVKGGEPFLLCIDGQQRCTTFQLMISSLRDTILHELRDLNSVVDQKHTVRGFVVRNAVSAVAKVDQLLFRNARGVNSWVQQFAHTAKFHELDNSWSDVSLIEYFEQIWKEVLPAGAIPRETQSTLLPSFVDRSPFFACILGGLCAQEMWKVVSFSTDSNKSSPHEKQKHQHQEGDVIFKDRVARAVTASYMKLHSGSRQVSAKRIFDQGVKMLLQRSVKIANGSRANALCSRVDRGGSSSSSEEEEELLDLGDKAASGASSSLVKFHEERLMCLAKETKRLIKRFSFVMTEVISDINLPQVFLWLQEKSLFGMGALLFNPTPGVKFHASDLIRNFVLSDLTEAATQHGVHHTALKDASSSTTYSFVSEISRVQDNQTPNSTAQGSHDSRVEGIGDDVKTEQIHDVIPVLSLAREEETYRRLWLDPLELKMGGPGRLDECILDYLKAVNRIRQYSAFKQVKGFRKFEKTLKIFEETSFGQYVYTERAKVTGIGLYAKFVSAAEVVELSSRVSSVSHSASGTERPNNESSSSSIPLKKMASLFDSFSLRPMMSDDVNLSAQIDSSRQKGDGDDHVLEEEDDDDSDALKAETILVSRNTCLYMLNELRAYADEWRKAHPLGEYSQPSVADRDREAEEDEAHKLIY